MEPSDLANRGRRRFVGRAWPLALAACGLARPAAAAEPEAALQAIARRVGGRLGVHAIDTASRRAIALDADQRFAMCSTFKLPLAAAVLAQVDAGRLQLDQKLAFGPADMVSHAPVTSTRLAQGAISVREACAAMVEVSDNPAANLLLAQVGGPAGFTRFLRSMGDEVTRLDRIEPDLNQNLPGDPRDTTTPRAMTRTLETLLLEAPLKPASRTQLADWAIASSTGLRRLRAGLPGGRQAGDKTGTGMNGAVNDVAIAWPPGRAPLLITVYMSGSDAKTEALEEAHAQIARVVVEAFVS